MTDIKVRLQKCKEFIYTAKWCKAYLNPFRFDTDIVESLLSRSHKTKSRYWTNVNADNTVVAVRDLHRSSHGRQKLCPSITHQSVLRTRERLRSIVMSMSVCVSVCPRGYLRNHTRDLYLILCMLPICLWLGPPSACWRQAASPIGGVGWRECTACVIYDCLVQFRPRHTGQHWQPMLTPKIDENKDLPALVGHVTPISVSLQRKQLHVHCPIALA